MDDAATPGASDGSDLEQHGTPAPTDGASTDATAPTRRRRWARTAGIAGITALALVGAATIGAVAVGGPRLAAVRDDGPHAGGPGRAMPERVMMVPARDAGDRLGRAYASGHRDGVRSTVDRAESRTARIEELATALDLDVAELTDAVTALHAEREAERAALREELADATPEERRAAMQAAMEAGRERMRELLVGLGADAEAVDALLAEHAGPHEGRHRAGMRAGRGL